MMRINCLVFLLLASFIQMNGQMLIDGQVRFGNEWINYNDQYLEVKVDKEGMYKITYNDLITAGFSASSLRGNDLQMYSLGEQVAVYNTNNGQWGSSDYMAFYGQGQEGEIDQHLFTDAENEQLNPAFSMFSSERSYYTRLRPNANGTLRYESLSNDLSGNLPTPERYFLEKTRTIYSTHTFSPGTPVSSDVHYSHFITMEGFSTKLQRETTLEVEVRNFVDQGNAPDPRLILRTGSNNADHFIEITANNNRIIQDDYTGSRVLQYDTSFAKNNIKNNNTNLFKLRGFSTADNLSVSYLELRYPRSFDAENANAFTFYGSTNNFQEYVEVSNFNSNGTTFLFDVDNGTVTQANIDGQTAKILIKPDDIKDAKLILMGDSSFKNPVSINTVSFSNFDNINPEYLILTSKELNQTVNGRNAVQEYADFRASDLGGSYKTAIIDVEDIFDQFGYGIDDHSIAIRNFSQYVKTKWPDFEMVFIMGKALAYDNKIKNTISQNLVPTYGKPGSDNLLFAEEGLTYPYVAVGRLAAQNQGDILNYLDKALINARISEVENLSIEDRLWLKEILHLSGGDVGIQEDLFNHLNKMATTVEGNDFAANVSTVRKNSSDPVTTALTQDILKKVNSGVSMMTFFGHSSAGTFDFSIEDPSAYENYGRHPVVFSMGCHSGDIHENVFSLSENFILTEEVGAIAFVASSGNAFEDALAFLGNSFYDHIGDDFYGQPIGLAVRQTLEDGHKRIADAYQQTSMNRPFFESFVEVVTLQEQNTLHGDPAIIFFTAEAPDYITDLSSVRTTKVVGTSDEFIELELDIVNLGSKGDLDELNNIAIHTYNGKSDTIQFTSIAPINRETIIVKIPNPGAAALGSNCINIILDHDDRVAEEPSSVAENNNSMADAWNLANGFCFLVFDNNAKPIYPKEYGIVGQQGAELLASSSNVLEDKMSFLVEIDTTKNFNSPLLVSDEIVSSPAVIKWVPSITYENETVYYWRVKPKNSESIWAESSFIYLTNSTPGWNQSHYHQWVDDSYKNVSVDSVSRDFIFADNINEIIIKNGVAASAGYLPQLVYQNEPTDYLPFGGEITSGVYLATFDGNTGVPRYNNPANNGEFGSFIASTWVEKFTCYPYQTDTKTQRKLVIDFIEDIVPDGDYIALFTIQRSDLNQPHYKPQLWEADSANGDPDLFSILEKHGARQVRQLVDDVVPYILLFKKNDPTYQPIEIRATDVNSNIDANLQIVAKWFEGEMESTTIGPASSWDKLLWNIDEIDLQEDSYRLNIIGTTPSGADSLLFTDIDEFVFDLSSVDATQYPYLKLNLYTEDEASRTSAQTEYWRVLYKGIPEAVIDTETKFSFEADSIRLGNTFKFSSLATNVTDVDMDSLLVEYTITNQANQVTTIQDRLAPLKAFETLDLDFALETQGYIGTNEFKVEINPRKDQVEEHEFNNVGVRNFKVTGDDTNPLLDVTFDGVRILNGDIVSPNPTIVAVLKDDSTTEFVSDVSNFDFALQALPDNQSFPIDLTGSNVSFFPADSTNGFCARLEYTPEPALESGDYVLSVQAWDAAGNLSGDKNLSIEFTVITESMVSNVVNYPNPFSTSTEFIFTLTGSQVPDVFTIQIFTMSGKVVKEISKEELGNVRIGVNRSSYKWNGTDDFGSKLANGVYLYRVITSEVEGESVDHYENKGIDSFFKKGFGKLVIMR